MTPDATPSAGGGPQRAAMRGGAEGGLRLWVCGTA